MGINKQVIEFFLEQSKKHIITDIVVGLKFIFVELDRQYAGISNIGFDDLTVKGYGKQNFMTQSAYNVICMLESGNGFEQSVAWAVVNALSRINIDYTQAITGNIVDIIGFERQDKVFMFGHFKPIEQRLRNKVSELLIADLRSDGDSGIVPSSSVSESVKGCNKIVLTATALINKTFEQVISLFNIENMPQLYMLGPSTPFMLSILQSFHINALSGIKIIDSKRLRSIIAQGGGTRSFGETVRQINFILA